MSTDYEIHPYCNLFPDLSAEELKELAADIAENGQTEPVRTWKKKVIDGKNRLAACREAGVQPEIEPWYPSLPEDEAASNAEALAFVLSKNLRRRHLSASQKGLIAAGIANMKRGDNQHTAGEDGAATPTSRSQAAKALDVSLDVVKDASKVLAHGSSELVESVRNGTISAHDASQVAKLPKREQNSAVKDVKAGRAPTVAKAAKQKAAKTDGLLEQLDGGAPQSVTKVSSESQVIDELMSELRKAVEKPKAIIAKLTEAFQQKAKACGVSFATHHASMTKHTAAVAKAAYPEVTEKTPDVFAAVVTLADKWAATKKQVDDATPAMAKSVTSLKR